LTESEEKEMSTNVRKVNCKICKRTLLPNEGLKVPYHGKSYFFLCAHCADYDSHRNDIPRLKKTKDGFVYAIELEENRIAVADQKLRLLGYVRKHEGSVTGNEWVSQPIQNLNGFAKLLRYQLSHGLVVTSGTHLNISNESFDNAFYQYCINNYTAIFGYLFNAMQLNHEKTRGLFGRDTNSNWCSSLQSCGKYTPFRIECNYDNPSVSRFEFRIAQLINPTQYVQTMKHARNMLTIIYNGYINNTNPHTIGTQLESWFNKQ
jgi:hypothetical protein